ncbi:MAG: tRNA (adenosine(37)-N6)-threonylcarbamoyltransferase complex ATPase subunit type 1 TsaE [Deltaproteobacteria bacterium]|nr:tRNA (adenosine(37)-N6)-threonylcarbamoyltransferase complex ATPase subunit type 1 TsaE [Deltaproteobacteria bacterium]
MPHRDNPAGEITLVTASAAETRRLGERCGRRLRTPLVICLIGDLGSGKTVFVQGLARGLDVSADYAVTSPSFTLINEYPGRLRLFHIDLYRLDAQADLDDLGLAEILHGEGVAAVEWAEKLTDGALAERLEIRFEFGDDDRRRLHMVAYGQASLILLKALRS